MENKTNYTKSVTGVVIKDGKVLLARHTYGAGKFSYHFKNVEFAVYTTDKKSRNYKAFGNIKIN